MYHQTILETWGDEPPEIRSTKASKTGEGVIDESTFRTIEIDGLFDAVNHAKTVIGQATLYRSLAQPPEDLDTIQAKQDSLRELESNAQLREKISQLVENASNNEQDFYRLLYGTFMGFFGNAKEPMEIDGYGYESYIKGTRFMLGLTQEVQALPETRSSYLKGLVDKIVSFGASRAYSLMQGPAYISEKGILCKEEKSTLTPAVRFRPTLFKPVFIAVVIGILVLLGKFYPLATFGVSTSAVPILILLSFPLLMVYVPIVGGFDRDSCIYPLRTLYKNAAEVQETLDALGELDELLSFMAFSENFGGTTVLPKFRTAKHHSIDLKKVKNPILGKGNEDYVPNDFVLDAEKLAFITGPNSGGKTAFCKTVSQVQLLAQIGCYVPAEQADLAVADRIFYQVPEISHLIDGEGRFGTELKRTKEIFLASSPRSLVVLDELSEGTTYEEKLETSANVLNGFLKKGNNTILITHNHELVDKFTEQGIGKPLQVEFVADHPTYKLVPGISRVSHADRVAKKIGFSKDDIDRYLSDND
ncbi:MAG: DNA mismatch repair protein MutS [Pseudomonadota bacterium]